MSEIRKEVHSFIDILPDEKLAALKPILTLLVDNEPLIIETDLTDEERAIIAQGREEYAQGGYVSLDSIQ